MQAILERGRKTQKIQTSFYYPQSRNESDPQQKARNSAVFYFLNKSHTGVALPTKPLYFSLFPFRKKKKRKGGLSKSMHDRTRKTVNYG